VFQAEFDFGVPQFRLVLQPFLIAAAAAFSLVVARLWIGRGAAVAAVVFYLLVRGGVSVVVGPVLGELWAAVPLYLAEALLVELAALKLARRPLLLGVVSGALIGTVGYAAEHAWTQVAFRLPWTSDIVVEGVAMATVAGVAAGLLGGLLVRGLRRDLPDAIRPRLIFGAALAAIAICAGNGVVATHPDDLHGTVAVADAGDGEVDLEVTFDRDPVAGEPAWLTVTGWQGGRGSEGLVVDHLEEERPGVWSTTRSVPAEGSWKTMVRLHDGRSLTAMPIYLPEDTALDEPEVPVEDGTRPFDEEKLLLQRELSDDVPGWLWLAAGSVVLLCSLALVLGLGWGVSRFARATQPGVGASRQPKVPA